MNNNTIIVLTIFVCYMLYKQYAQYQVLKLVPDLLEKGAQIIDVRSTGEFLAGNKQGSINIPLDTLKTRMNELDKSKPVILCCASGSRSGFAKRQFKAAGFSDVHNAGIWRSLTKI